MSYDVTLWMSVHIMFRLTVLVGFSPKTKVTFDSLFFKRVSVNNRMMNEVNRSPVVLNTTENQPKLEWFSVINWIRYPLNCCWVRVYTQHFRTSSSVFSNKSRVSQRVGHHHHVVSVSLRWPVLGVSDVFCPCHPLNRMRPNGLPCCVDESTLPWNHGFVNPFIHQCF